MRTRNARLRLTVRPALAAVVIAALALVQGGAIHASAPSFTNTQVNATLNGPFPKNKQNEPSLAQNPTNALNLISGSNDEIQEPACTNATPSSCPFAEGVNNSGFYASFDGGKTWPCQGIIDLSVYGQYSNGDPAQAFDSRGNAYYGTLAFPSPATRPELAMGVQADLFVAKSTDGGCTYKTAAKVSSGAPALFDDKDAIAADASAKSPYRDNVYAAWTKFTGQSGNGFGSDQIVFSRSTDGGATWSHPNPLSAAHNNGHAGGRQGAAVQVGPDGTVYVAWGDTVQKQSVELVAISHDGGAHFDKPVTAATVLDDGLSPLPGSSFRQDSRTFPSLSVGSAGNVYIAWSDHTGGHAVLKVAASHDGGQSWATTVAGDVTGRSAFFASVAVDPAGKVNVVFNAMDDKPAGTAPGAGVVIYDAYFVQSTNGGSSYSAPLKVSTASSDPDASSANSLAEQFLGDYITAVADSRGGGVFAVWTDTRNGSTCAAVDAYRAGTAAKPNVITQCPNTFGNSDIFLGTISY